MEKPKKKPLEIVNVDKSEDATLIVEPHKVILSIPDGLYTDRMDEMKLMANEACNIGVAKIYKGTFVFKKTLVRCQLWTERQVARMTLTVKNKTKFEATW